MNIVVGLVAAWIAVAAVFTFGVARALARSAPFEVEAESELDLVG
ncbi:hypothetical protein [Nocardioides albidus]|nr:hypothetical protein [Nocardioides albidus]